jgi:pilus assembly protein CpaF
MRPDRIVVGECRGPEALDMLQAMNTGHEGSLSTCHANSPDDALRRLETMVLMGDVALPLGAIREQLTSALDLLVMVSRAGARRHVSEVAEVLVGEALGGGAVRTRQLASSDGVMVVPTRPSRRSPGPVQ